MLVYSSLGSTWLLGTTEQGQKQQSTPILKETNSCTKKQKKAKQKLFLYDRQRVNQIMTKDKLALVTFFQEGCIFGEVTVLYC